MRYVLLLGSNTTPEAHLANAREALERAFGILRLSPELWSPDRDQQNNATPAPRYLNQAVEIATPHDASGLKSSLRDIEAKCGRTRPPLQPGICEIDIDVALVFLKSDAKAHWHWLDEKARDQAYARIALQGWIS